MKISENIKKTILKIQQTEVTEAVIYREIAKKIKNSHNKKLLQQIANEELKHAKVWEQYTQKKLKAKKLKVWWYKLLNKLFGFTFTVRLMEKNEINAQETYLFISEEVPEAMQMYEEESSHEDTLIGMLNENRLKYVGSIVLGLNDAIVELSGALVGFTLAFSSLNIISFSGLITGIAASLSMASSEYLSARTNNEPDAIKSAIFTGITYFITVVLLTTPYLLLITSNYIYAKWIALGIMIVIVLVVIAVFNYYISVAKRLSFKKRFWEMAIISISVAFLSFVIGTFLRNIMGI